MRTRILLVLLTLFVLGSIPASARPPQEKSARVSDKLQRGLVVEKVDNHSEAEKAGLQEGDILLGWTRGDLKQPFESPFDLSLIEIEQAPLGTVTLQGQRSGADRSWQLGPNIWGVKVRPNFTSRLLAAYREGRALIQAGRPALAAERWRTMTTDAAEAPAPWLLAWQLWIAAQSYAEARSWKEADAAYEESLREAEKAGPAVAMQVARSWAAAFRQRNDSAKADEYYHRALTESQKLDGDGLSVAGNLNDLGGIAFDRGELDRAEQYYVQASAVAGKRAPESRAVAQSFSNLGNVAWARGDLTTAEEDYRKSLAIRQKRVPGSLDMARSFIQLGNIAGDRGDLALADDYNMKALQILERVAPGSRDVAGTLNNLGLGATNRGDLAAAENYYRRGYAILVVLAPGSLDVERSFNNLGLVAWLRGDLPKAEEYFRGALAITQKLAPDTLYAADNYTNLGDVGYDKGDFEKAEDFHQKALTIRRKLAPGSLSVAVSLLDLGAVAEEKHDFAKAESYALEALALEQKLAPGGLENAETLNLLGDLAQDRHDLDEAEKFYRQALAIRQKVVPDSTRYAETLAALAGVLRRKGQLEPAMQFYGQALDALEGQTARLGGPEDVRSGFRARHADYYSQYIDLLVAHQRPELAFQVLERSRAQTLLEILAAGHVDIREGVDASLLESERSLRLQLSANLNHRVQLLSDKYTAEQLAAIDKTIAELSSRYSDVEGQIRISSPNYAGLTQPKSLSAAEVQSQLLDPDTLLLEYSLGESRSYLFALTSTSLTVHELPSRAEIEEIALHAYDLLTARNRIMEGEIYSAAQARAARVEREYPGVASRISKMLLGPVAAQIQGKRLLVVSDGALYYLPFSALPAPGNPSVPLIVEHEIVNLPSASVVAVLRQASLNRKQPSKAVAILADPVFSTHDPRVKGAGGRDKANAAVNREVQLTDESPFAALTRSIVDLRMGSPGTVFLRRLPLTRAEARSILSLAPSGQAMEALDFDANRATATSSTLAQYRIVHFATHGLLNNNHPELSGLVFSLVNEKGSPQDGFLGLQDIYNLKLPVELVVLSACETSLGKQVSGEGLIGITRGFMNAGATRVVGTLWSVSDVATARLMALFYKAMERDGLSPAAGLRAAQIQMWKHRLWRSPYYWAAFQIQGEFK